MNLSKLFEAQKVLMERIEKEHPPVEGEDRFNKRILALLVEVGECANEQRTWKFWSKDQEPRNFGICTNCSGCGEGYFSGNDWTGSKELCVKCSGTGRNENKNPLLEELVDILHFVLEVGLVTNTVDYEFLKDLEYPDLPSVDAPFWFIEFYYAVLNFHEEQDSDYYNGLITEFLYLASELGFAWEEIEQAYFEKNAVNHQRQSEGY